MKEISFNTIKKLSKSTCIISLMYAIFIVLGKYAISEKYIDFANFKVYILIFITFLPINFICILLFNWLDNLEKKRNLNENNEIFNSKKMLFIYFGIIIAFWIPQFLSLFPGCFSYDAMEILNQEISGNYIGQYPPLYSMILVGFIKMSYRLTGGNIFGIATYVIIQMIISAGVFVYSIYILDKYNISKKIKVFAVIYYSIFPAVYLYVLAFTKDSLFNCFFYLSFLLYLELIYNKEEFFKSKKWIFLLISNLIAILLRRNAIYVFVLFSIILAFVILPKNKSKIKTISVFVLPIVLFFIINSGLNKYLNVEEEKDVSGMLSVPVQQIAFAYNNNPDSINKYQKDKILEVVDDNVIRNYYPEVSDSIIYYSNKKKIVEEVKEYSSIWLDIGKSNISNYLNAIVRLDYGYFYPDAIQKVYIKGETFETGIFNPNWFIIGLISNKIQIFENLNIFNSVIASGMIQRIPIIKYICSIGAFVWIFIFAISYLIYKKRKKFVLASMFIVLLLLTYVLGPLVMVRYYLILFFIFPVIISVIFNSEKW